MSSKAISDERLSVSTTSSPAPLLEVTDLQAFYGEAQALSGVSFHILPGEIVSIVGANGAGKTTLIRAIAGMTPVRSGSIRFNGREIAGSSSPAVCELGIAQVPEGRQIFPSLSVEENLRLGAVLNRARSDKARNFERVYASFPKLAERRTQSAGTLSGGEQQMLAIGRALMARPKMILMDEPSMGLSPLLVKEVFAIIQKINRDLGVTILLVEQNARAALSVASHGYIMEQGKVVLDGSADELRDNEDVKEFYLGGAGDQRKSFKNLKSFKRRKRWL